MTTDVFQSATLPKVMRTLRGPATWGQTDIAAAVQAHYDPRTSNRAAAGRDPFRMLEAGGGSSSWVPLPHGAEITTVDISQEQLDQRRGLPFGHALFDGLDHVIAEMTHCHAFERSRAQYELLMPDA